MKKKNKVDVVKTENGWKFSHRPFLANMIVGCAAVIIGILIGTGFYIAQETERRTEAMVQGFESSLEKHIAQTIKILEALAGLDQYDDPTIPASKHVASLRRLNERMGYASLDYVDSKMNVHLPKSVYSLAQRDYLKKVFVFGAPQVSDGFLSAHNGESLSYAISVPILKEGKVNGALVASQEMDTITQQLEQAAKLLHASGGILGSSQQVMASTGRLIYGDSYISILNEYFLLGTTQEDVETSLYNRKNGGFWSLRGGELRYSAYRYVDGTNWDIVISTNILTIYKEYFSSMLIWSMLCVLLFTGIYQLSKKRTKSQLETVEQMVKSFSELEYSIYNADRPEDVEFQDIVHMTKKGLNDGLTGGVTRSVFLSQLLNLMKQGTNGRLMALCFVDLDDLKPINDTYGHGMGDAVLKEIGYALREYEKEYDGIMGRYGGDEFALCLTGIRDEAQLRYILEELVMRLQITIPYQDKEIFAHCSVGVSIWDGVVSCDMLINQADEALYFVKKNGKSYYKIYQN